MAKLIYIISAGHSGSTLLDLLTGTLPSVFSLGEVRRFPWQVAQKNLAEASIANQNICSCLQTFRECPVWSNVLVSLSEKVGYDVSQNPKKFHMSMLIRHAADENMNLFDKAVNKAYKESFKYKSAKFVNSLIYKSQLEAIRNSWALFDSVGEVTGDEYVVDSSKDISRFFFLQAYRPQDSYLLINKRDPIRYANSYIKQGLSPEESLKSRYRFYKAVEDIIGNSPGVKYHEVKYETLCEDPVGTRDSIADFVGIKDPGELKETMNTRDYHLVEGNPMRYKGEIKIRLDNKWKQELNATELEEISNLVKKIYH